MFIPVSIEKKLKTSPILKVFANNLICFGKIKFYLVLNVVEKGKKIVGYEHILHLITLVMVSKDFFCIRQFGFNQFRYVKIEIFSDDRNVTQN